MSITEQLTRKPTPYRITPIGEIVFETSGAKKSMENHSDFLMLELEKIDPKTAYDIENSALTVLIQNLGHELFNEVKKYLYNAPEMLDVVDPTSNETIKVRLSMQGILKVMSIHLRDEYLSKHTEIV